MVKTIFPLSSNNNYIIRYLIYISRLPNFSLGIKFKRVLEKKSPHFDTMDLFGNSLQISEKDAAAGKQNQQHEFRHQWHGPGLKSSQGVASSGLDVTHDYVDTYGLYEWRRRLVLIALPVAGRLIDSSGSSSSRWRRHFDLVPAPVDGVDQNTVVNLTGIVDRHPVNKKHDHGLTVSFSNVN